MRTTRTARPPSRATTPGANRTTSGGPPPSARQNRAIQANYGPGSSFKAFTVSGAMSEKLVEPGTTLSVPPEIQVADRTVGEAHDGGGGIKTLAQILKE